MEVTRSSGQDPQMFQLQERLAKLEVDLAGDRADRVQVNERIGGLEIRMSQMTSGKLEGVLIRVQQTANRVLDAQGKVSSVEKRLARCADNDARIPGY